MRAMDCADYIVDIAIEHDLDITNLQLQKALYVFAAEYIREFNEYPYDEDKIMAWKYGPAIHNVYKEYNKYGSLPITEVSNHRRFNPNIRKFESNIYDRKNISDDYQEIVEEYLEEFLSINIFKIVEFTHSQKFWASHRKEIYQYDTLEYPENEISLNQPLADFLGDL